MFNSKTHQNDFKLFWICVHNMVQNGVDQTQNFLLLNFTFWILSKTIWIRKHILDGSKLFTKYFYLMNPVWLKQFGWVQIRFVFRLWRSENLKFMVSTILPIKKCTKTFFYYIKKIIQSIENGKFHVSFQYQTCLSFWSDGYKAHWSILMKNDSKTVSIWKQIKMTQVQEVHNISILNQALSCLIFYSIPLRSN